MDTQKIIEKFGARKRNTEAAITDLYEIMDWVEKTTDNINVRTETEIGFRASYYGFNSDLIKRSSEHEKMEIAVIDGVCNLFIVDEYGEMDETAKYWVDYISLFDCQKAIVELLTKLSEFSTREKSASKIKAIVDLLK